VSAALALLLVLAAGPALDCPAGTGPAGAVPPEGFEAWCEGVPDDAGRPRRQGPSRAWYDDGTLRVEATWVHGRRDGPFVEYHRNGKKAQAGRYLDDERDGPWSTWSEGGQLLERVELRRGVRHGPFAAWHQNGRRKTEGRFCQGMQCGSWISWDESGRELGRMALGEPMALPMASPAPSPGPAAVTRTAP
jgi:hypothetical protein